MTTIYVRHDVTTVAEVNALALEDDQRKNGAIVLYKGITYYWSINWGTRKENPGRWYDNSRDGLQLVDGDEVTVLVPIEAEERIGSEMCHQITDKRYDIHVLPAGDEKQARWQIENNPDYATGRIMRQYRTPWEEA